MQEGGILSLFLCSFLFQPLEADFVVGGLRGSGDSERTPP